MTASTTAGARPPQQHARRQSIPLGGLPRAPILRQPEAQLALRERFPARPTETSWPATQMAVEDLLAALTRADFHTADQEQRGVRRRGVAAVLAWLGDQPGDTWQQRWQASGTQNVIGNGWVAVPLAWYAAHGRSQRWAKELIQVGVQVLTCRDVIRPDLGWMLRRRSGFLRAAMTAMRDPDGFARLDTLCALDGQVAAVLGTHTHDPTLRGHILPRGTGYVTEVGMTGRLGHTGGGFDPAHFAAALRGDDITTMPPYRLAAGPMALGAVLLTTDTDPDRPNTVTAIERLT